MYTCGNREAPLRRMVVASIESAAPHVPASAIVRAGGGASYRPNARMALRESRAIPHAMRPIERGPDIQTARTQTKGAMKSGQPGGDRKSTRLNSSHVKISYA